MTDSLGARNETAWRSDPESKHHSGTTLTDALIKFERKWPTPMARYHRSLYATEQTHSNLTRPESGGRPLSEVVGRWVTPTVAISSGGQTSRSGDRKDELLLSGQATSLSSPLGPETSKAGPRSSNGGLQLNPLFVEWLMGWPTGWTACACSETEFSRWKAHMRSELLRIGLPPKGPPAQTDLFG